jgi:hypothetical protein
VIRAQRRLHARVFYVLTPLLLAALAFALVQRQRSAAELTRHPLAFPALEKVP